MDKKYSPVRDISLLNIINEIRLDEGNDLELIDKLVRIIGTRKILIRYQTNINGDIKYVFLTRSVAWKLRSFFLEKGYTRGSHAGEYLSDVFVKQIHNMELLE